MLLNQLSTVLGALVVAYLQSFPGLSNGDNMTSPAAASAFGSAGNVALHGSLS